MTAPALLDVHAVALLMGKHEETVRRWARGETPGIPGAPARRVGGTWMWSVEEIERALPGSVSSGEGMGYVPDREWNGPLLTDGAEDRRKMIEDKK